MKTTLRSLFFLLSLTSLALAQQAPAPPPGDSASPKGQANALRPAAPRTPPPEAVAACSVKAVGTACTFQHKDRTETGSCFTPDPAQPVACKPVRPPREECATPAR